MYDVQKGHLDQIRRAKCVYGVSERRLLPDWNQHCPNSYISPCGDLKYALSWSSVQVTPVTALLHNYNDIIWIKFIREWVRNWGNYHTMRSVTIYIWSNIHPIFSSQPSSSTNMAKAHNKCIIEFDPQYSTCKSNTDLLWWLIIVASLKYREEKMMYTWTYLNVFLSHVGCCYCICAAPPWCWTNLAQPFLGECIYVHLPYHDLSKHFTASKIWLWTFLDMKSARPPIWAMSNRKGLVSWDSFPW